LDRGTASIVACCALALAACYAGVQRTTQVAVSERIDPVDGDPASDVSFTDTYYELVAGAFFRRFEVFSGIGLPSDQRVRQRTADAAVTADTPALARAHLGLGLGVGQVDGFEVRVVGVVASDLNSVYGIQDVGDDPMVITSKVSSSRELGVQLSPVAARSRHVGAFLEPVVRISIASQSGTVQPLLYRDADGGGSFEAFAILVTLGVNGGFSMGFR